MSNLVALGFVMLAALLSAAGNLLLKYSRLETTSVSFLESLFSKYFIFGLFCYAINVILFVKALEKLPVSSAYPILAGLGFVLLAIGARKLFAENLSTVNMIGMALIISGVYLTAK
ncbi:undecaprenyl phosphate-alpha-L-ara4N flippase subunit ArnE [Methylococcales bacterium]|nr:undecaprenyl phosphate-alpha-L-ara4N flippase subunit ArnE [Methylococcales bacterium]